MNDKQNENLKIDLPEKQGDYKVGDKHPPREYQWKPGEAGNPKGRPLGIKYLSEWARELLQQVPRGELEGKTADELVTLALLRKALGGDTRAIEMLHDWTEGKVTISIGGDSENPIYIVNVPSEQGKEDIERVMKGEGT